MSAHVDINWSEQLKSWSELPSDSAVWDQIDGFVVALRSLATAKIDEREAGRNELRAKLSKLFEAFTADLSYFEAQTGSWKADSIQWDVAQGAAQMVVGLIEALAARRTLQQKSADHYAEARLLREEIAKAEDAVVEQIAIVEGVFGTGCGPQSASMVVNGAAAPGTVDTPAPDHLEVADDYHSQLDAEHGKYSPLTVGQEKSIVEAGLGVSMVLASGALGFEHLQEASAHIHTVIGKGAGAFGAAPPALATETDVFQWIHEFCMAHPDAERMFIIQPAALSAPNIVERFLGALRYCRDYPNRELRMIFLLAPGAVWAWYLLKSQDRIPVESELRVTVSVEPWTPMAIRNRLQLQGKLADAETVELAHEATGGWPWCLDKVFEICGSENDPRPAIEQVRQGLLSAGQLHDEFLMRIGVRANTPPWLVLNFIQSECEIESGLVTPELIEGTISLEECAASIDFLVALKCIEAHDGVLKVNPLLAAIMSS